MFVYRVSTKDEIGPYAGGICNARHYDEDHPSPDGDGIPANVRWEYTHHYGFKSKEQLLGWFSKADLRRFEKEQYYVWRYSVPKSAVHFGQRQVAFELKKVSDRKRVLRSSFDDVKAPEYESKPVSQQAWNSYKLGQYMADMMKMFKV